MNKFKQWLRGTEFPYSAEWGEWENIHDAARKKHPIRYWLAEDLWDWCGSVVSWPLRKYRGTKSYISNRFKTKTHVLQLDLQRDWVKKGKWIEYDTRLLYGVMDSFVIWLREEWYPNRFWDGFDDSQMTEKEKFLALWDARIQMYRENAGEDSEEGWIHACKEMREIYLWWTDFDEDKWLEESPWTNHCNKMRSKHGRLNFTSRTKEEKDQGKEALKEHTRLEQENEDEITEMLIRLFKLRKYLWC